MFEHYGDFLEGIFSRFRGTWTYWDLIHLICESEQHALMSNKLLPGDSFSLTDQTYFDGFWVGESDKDGIVCLGYYFDS